MSSAKERLKKSSANGTLDRSGLSRRIIWLVAMIFLFSVLLPGIAAAHPPKEVTLSYDAAAKILKVKILHTSPMPSWHYIKTVNIEQNKKPLASYTYESQPGKEFTYEYAVTALPGDTLVVTAACNMYGTRTESLTIPAAPKP